MRPKRAPHTPTQAEVAAREITHEPYCDWRRACVAGRGLADRHVQSDHSEVALPTVAFDYGYLGDREEECSHILCGYGPRLAVVLRHPHAAQGDARRQLREADND